MAEETFGPDMHGQDALIETPVGSVLKELNEQRKENKKLNKRLELDRGRHI